MPSHVIRHGGGGAEGLQVPPGEAGGEPREFPLDDGLEFGGVGKRSHVEEYFVIAGGGGVEGAFDGGVGVRGGEGGFQIAGVALREEFEVDDVGDGGGEAIEQRADQHGGGNRRRSFRGDAGVEPGQGGFGLGVTRVVEGEGVGGDGMCAGENFVEPFGYAFAGGGIDAAGGGGQGGSPPNEQIGFGLLVGAEELEIGIGEGRGGVKHDGEGSDAETIGVVAQERAEGGGDDVGTTAHGFGEDDFGRAGGEAVEGID